jgi:hypothetical protein
MARLRLTLGLMVFPALALVAASCSSPEGETPPGTGGSGASSGGAGGRGGSGTGGRGGSGTAGGTGGSSQAGGAGGTGTGGSGTGGTTGGATGTGGSAGGAGGSGQTDGPAGDDSSVAGSGGSGTGGAGGSGGSGVPPTDAGPVSSTCDYAPKANAASRQLRFERVTLTGLPAANNERPYNGGITEAKFLPGTMDELFIVRKGGQVYHYKMSGTSAALVATMMVPNVSGREDCGLIGMAFDPDYATNKFVYFGHCVGAAGRESRFMRYTHNNNMLSDGVQILGINGGGGSSNSWHSVGSMGFDKDKNLWMLHGEFVTGAPAQDMNSNLGKLLRVRPGRTAGMGGFMPATGNPAGNAVYARGLRSPWRGAYHPGKDWYIVAEVGPDPGDWEEVNVVTAPGANLGWPMGTCNAGSIACWRSGLTTMKLQATEDVSDQYSTRAGRSAWAGPPYGDCGNDRYGGAMTGVFLAGDFFKGWVLGVVLNDDGSKNKDVNLGTFTMISSITQGPDGYLYITKFGKYHQGAEGENVANQGLYRVLPM